MDQISSSPVGSSLPDQETIHLPTVTPPHRSRRRSSFPVVSVVGLLVVILGAAAGIFLVRVPQDIRNQAFTGFVSRLGGQTTTVSSELRFAEATEVPQNPILAGEEGYRGSFYTYAEEFQNARPEYQEISLPEFLIAGQVFLEHDQTSNSSTLFSRIVGFPEELFGESSRVWLETSDGQFVLLGGIDLEIEDGMSVAYATYRGPGDLKQDSAAIHFSQDTDESDAQQKPGFIVLTVKM